MESHKPIHSVQ